MNSAVIEGLSRAKINLHLAVLNRRDDGFHNISSLMAALELSDVLTLRNYDFSGSRGAEVSVIDGGGEYGHITAGMAAGDNLISAGVKNYLKRISAGGTFEFSVVKNIPSGAGLGGGSSNAACAIELVRQALGRDRDDACYLAAAETGSDVLFFLYGGFAFASGRGEVISPFVFNCGFHVVLVNNGIHVSTASAYKALNRDYACNEPGDNDVSRIKEFIGKVGSWKEVMRNDFEEAVFAAYPEIGRIKERLYGLGADYAAMTGSGSTVFGVFKDYNSAVSACGVIGAEGRVVLTKFAL